MSMMEMSESRIEALCPFTIQEIQLNDNTTSNTFLIREYDQYGEFPHIYAKICRSAHPNSCRKGRVYRESNTSGGSKGRLCEQDRVEARRVIVLSDTGCGTEVLNPCFSREHPSTYSNDSAIDKTWTARTEPEVWNLHTFLEYTINPGGKTPYLVITTHCHYDHIMGIGKLPPTSMTGCNQPPPTIVLTSSRSKEFVTPYTSLQKHSLCGTLNLSAPEYNVGIWAEDMSKVEHLYFNFYSTPVASISTPFTTLHTPGHTPDSLSWYDEDLRLFCVGDSFYVKETATTRDAKWGSEPPMPVIFNLESDLADWWRSLKKVLKFVREKNAEVEDGNEQHVASRVKPPNGPSESVREEDAEADGFVLVEADDMSLRPTSYTEGMCSEKNNTQKRASVSTKANPSQQLQKQTGFYIPSPDQRGFVAVPTSSNHSILAPTQSPIPSSSSSRPSLSPIIQTSRTKTDDTTFDAFKQQPAKIDPWMLVLNRHLPLEAQVKRRQDEHPRPTAQSQLTPSASNLNPRAEPAAPAASQANTAPSVQRKNHRPRVKLCAAHTTLSVDAEGAILSIRDFLLGVLHDGLPCKRVEDGSRGEEMWLWDYSLDEESVGMDGKAIGAERTVAAGNAARELKYQYSVLAPIKVIEEGRKKILEMLGGEQMGRQPGRGGIAGRPERVSTVDWNERE